MNILSTLNKSKFFQNPAVQKVAWKASRAGLQLKKFSPDILTGIGLAGGVATVVMASKATLKAPEIINEFREYHEYTHESFDESTSKVEKGKNLLALYTAYGFKLFKLYTPTITVGLASAGCVLGAHGIMRKRNAALMASYAGVQKAFDEYRERVQDALGDEGENILFHNLEETKDENGEKHYHNESKFSDSISIYARFFDEHTPHWQDDPSYNRVFLQAQQNYFNDLLIARGHVFLNDVYDSLGLERTKAGSIVGWVLGDRPKDRMGDNYIDFGIFNPQNVAAREFVNNIESSILLDFNVDGVIYDLI